MAQNDIIPTIDLGRLTAKEQPEIDKLLQATQWPGFFYLDFRNDAITKDVAKEVQGAYAASERYFDQPHIAKMKDYRERQPASSDRGFKYCESDESFELSYDEMKEGNAHLPKILADNSSVLDSLHNHCHFAAHTVLTRLTESLSIPFGDYHRPGEPSETGLKLIEEPTVDKVSDVVENKHTDSGTFTILFYEQTSLQINIPNSEDWVFPPSPPPGCAIVHGGNSLKRISNNRLQSPLHRVTQTRDGAGKRYFLSYFLRPEDAVKHSWAAAGAA